jgi:hypothetical protein
LNGRQTSVRSEILVRAIESLSGVPDSTAARVKLLAGDLEAAENLARTSHDTDPAGWTPYFIELAKLRLKEGRARDARRALDRLGTGAREECDALLIRREVGRALQDEKELAEVARDLEPLSIGAASWEPRPESQATLSLCLDPERNSGRLLRVHVEVAGPTILVYGWNGARTGNAPATTGSVMLQVPLSGLAGRQDFFIGSLGGKSGSVLRTTSSIAASGD